MFKHIKVGSPNLLGGGDALAEKILNSYQFTTILIIHIIGTIKLET